MAVELGYGNRRNCGVAADGFFLAFQSAIGWDTGAEMSPSNRYRATQGALTTRSRECAGQDRMR